MPITDLMARQLASEIRRRFYSSSCRDGIVAVVMGVLRSNRVVAEADCMRVIAFFNGQGYRDESGEPPAPATARSEAQPVAPVSGQGNGFGNPAGPSASADCRESWGNVLVPPGARSA
jgi:hypothetical protein